MLGPPHTKSSPLSWQGEQAYSKSSPSPTETGHQTKGPAINDVGVGPAEIKKKNFGGPSPGKNMAGVSRKI